MNDRDNSILKYYRVALDINTSPLVIGNMVRNDCEGILTSLYLEYANSEEFQ